MVVQEKTSSYYRNHILLPIFISCTGWNMIRRTLGEAAPILIENGMMNQSNYALMNTIAFIIYGLSKFITSHLAKGNLFQLYCILFLFVGIVSCFEGTLCSSSSSFIYLFFFWVVNYALMGTLWPMICIIIKKWLPDEVRGFYWSIICCCSSIGTILCNTLSQKIGGDPGNIFISVGIIVVILAILTYLLFPQSSNNNEYIQVSQSSEYKESSSIQLKEIISISLLLFSVFISTLNQRVISDWALLMFPQIIHNPTVAKNTSATISYIETGGILGTLWCGWISDNYHISRSLICEITSVIAGILIAAIPQISSIWVYNSISFLLGFFLYIPFSFSELIAIESVDSKYTGFIISMNGLMSPFGSVFSGLPVDMLVKRFGWNSIPIVLCCSFILFSVLLWVNYFIRIRYGDSKDV